MPTVLRIGSTRFFFYAGDRNEPPHIHVEHDANTAKFWLKPVRYDKSAGFNRREVLLLERLITEHLEELLRSWHDYFGS